MNYEDILGDLAFLKNAASSMGWEVSFEASVVGSLLILIASVCVVLKNGFKLSHGTLWAMYWALVISFRVAKWCFTKKPKPPVELTEVEKLVLNALQFARYDHLSATLKGEGAWAVVKDENVQVFVKNRLVNERLSKTVLDTILKRFEGMKAQHFNAVKAQEEYEILNELRPKKREGSSIVYTSPSLTIYPEPSEDRKIIV